MVFVKFGLLSGVLMSPLANRPVDRKVGVVVIKSICRQECQSDFCQNPLVNDVKVAFIKIDLSTGMSMYLH